MKAAQRKGVPISVRIAPDIRAWISDQAKESGQSVTNAFERALLIGLMKQQEWGRRMDERSEMSFASLVDVLAEIVRANPKWLDNSDISKAVRDSFVAAIDVFFDLPVGDEP